jgi:methyltransferase (TIGR00027 family)
MAGDTSVTETVIADVSDTAFWVAHYRGVETQRADALFRDPLAGLLAGERGRQIARNMPMPQMTAWAVVIRTCIIDDFIRHALAQGVDTILNLGAGLDTRPYRMDLPASLVWIEVDFPKVIDFKSERLSQETPRCRLTRLKLDLADAQQRRQMLASVNASTKKMLILTEGVVPYLSADEVGSLADDLRSLERARYWIVDYFSDELLKFRRRQIGNKMQNAPFKFQPKDWFGFFAQHGWHCTEMRYLAEEAERLGRQLQLPLRLALMTKFLQLFASNARRAASKKYAGYALLEPSALNGGDD